MARNGSGVYSLPQPAFVPGTTIAASAMNSDLVDIGAALTQSISKDGQTAYTGNQPMGGNKLTGLGAGTAATDSVTVGQVIGGQLGYATDTGAANAYVIDPAPGITAYVKGQRFSFIVAHANTGASTLNVDGVGVGPIKWPNDDDMADGDLPLGAGVEVMVVDTAPIFQLQTVSVPGLSRDGGTITGDLTVEGTSTFEDTATFEEDVTFDKKAIVTNLVVASGSSFVPQGRLTLATGVPVMVSAQTGKTAIYYTPYVGNLIPIYDGTDMVATVFAELSNATAQSSTGKAGPAAVTTDSNYDLFVWNDADTIRLTRGPAWTDATTRSAGTALVRVNGVYLNNASITNGPAASRGTYVGTVRSDGSSQINWQPGGLAAGGTAAILGVWNACNRVQVAGLIGDTTDNWTYSGVARPANDSTAMRVSFVVGLQEDFFAAEYAAASGFAGGVTTAVAGIGYDATDTISGRAPVCTPANVGGNELVFNPTGSRAAQPLGFHYMQALERGGSKWYGDNGGVGQTGLTYNGRF